jgi:ADP-ribosylglycohydrolase
LQSPAKNQVLGCLLGGALGDALGGPNEGAAGAVVKAVAQDFTELVILLGDAPRTLNTTRPIA